MIAFGIGEWFGAYPLQAIAFDEDTGWRFHSPVKNEAHAYAVFPILERMVCERAAQGVTAPYRGDTQPYRAM